MIRWKRSFTYFLNNAGPGDSYLTVMERFAKRYNCEMIAIDTLRCKEEDFIIIQLACPEAVRCVI